MIAETTERTGAFGAGITPRAARSVIRAIAREGMLMRTTSRLISAAGFFRLHWARSDKPPTKRMPSNVSNTTPNPPSKSLSKNDQQIRREGSTQKGPARV
jgi:hypothetical protein